MEYPQRQLYPYAHHAWLQILTLENKRLSRAAQEADKYPLVVQIFNCFHRPFNWFLTL